MNTVKMTLITLAAVVSCNVLAMRPKQQPQTLAAQLSSTLNGVTKQMNDAYGKTKKEAFENDPSGGLLGVRGAVKDVVGAVTNIAGDVNGTIEDTQGLAELGVDGIEDALKDNKFLAKRPKLKRQVSKFLAEARTVIKPTIATAVIVYLLYSYVQAQKHVQVAEPTLFTKVTDKVGGWALRGKLGQMFAGLGFGGQAQPQAPAGLPYQKVVVHADGSRTDYTGVTFDGQIPVVQDAGLLTRGAVAVENAASNAANWVKGFFAKA